jgi:DHA1 family bicyclomycin/chloramphenicol resistance-like MFS transporter
MSNKARTIFILGLMTALSPFSIDMYLPAFQNLADDLGTTVARVSLSLSSYFVGLSFGQLFYGPLLDRFGRRAPVLAGILIYIAAALACLLSRTAESLIAWRFIQALGACGCGVGAMAMVRDLFSVKESAKVFSLLMLILGASPMLAPTTGGYLSAAFGWQAVFIALAAMASLLFLAIWFLLPESHAPDPQVSLKPGPILAGFAEIVRDPRFYTYVVSGAIAFSGLFVYIAGSPIIFLKDFGVSQTVYGWIFAIIAGGFIGVSQLNVLLLKRFDNLQLLAAGYAAQVAISLLFLLSVAKGLLGLHGTVFMFFAYMAFFGLTNPNGAALALAPFGHRAGRASAMMGFLQMGIGALMSSLIGIFDIDTAFPVVAIMASGSFAGALIVIYGRGRIRSHEALLFSRGDA